MIDWKNRRNHISSVFSTDVDEFTQMFGWGKMGQLIVGLPFVTGVTVYSLCKLGIL